MQRSDVNQKILKELQTLEKCVLVFCTSNEYYTYLHVRSTHNYQPLNYHRYKFTCSELGNERDRHSVSRLEVERLSNDLYRLGEQLKNTQQNKRKVNSLHELSSAYTVTLS